MRKDLFVCLEEIEIESFFRAIFVVADISA